MKIQEIAIQQLEGSRDCPSDSVKFNDVDSAIDYISNRRKKADHLKTDYQITFEGGERYEGNVILRPDIETNPIKWASNALRYFVIGKEQLLDLRQEAFDFMCRQFPVEAAAIEKQAAEEFYLFRN